MIDRQQLFDTMTINPGIDEKIKYKVERMRQNADRYAAILPPVKWWLIAVIHELECSQKFTKYLGNGQPLNKKTTIVPKGRGPFKTFEQGAIDALILQGADKIADWSIGNILYFLERFNGYGYEKYYNMPSPYLWSGSNHYTKGKYVTDGHFDPDAVSQQIGVALLLKNLI